MTNLNLIERLSKEIKLAANKGDIRKTYSLCEQYKEQLIRNISVLHGIRNRRLCSYTDKSLASYLKLYGESNSFISNARREARENARNSRPGDE